MCFKRIKFSFFVSREGSNSSEISSYFSQGSTSRKEIHRFLRHNSFWKLWPSPWHCRHLYFSSVVIGRMWMQCEDQKHEAYGEKESNKWKLAPESAAWEEGECSLSVASTKRCRSEVNIYLRLLQVNWSTSRTAWLNSALQKLSKTKSQTSSFPWLLKGQWKCKLFSSS